jgi:hypothetical protein
MLYNIILNILGYYSNNNNNDNLPLDIESGTVIVHDYNESKLKTKLLIISKFSYNLIILGLISWTIIFSIIVSFKENNIHIFGKNSFQVIFASQYIIGLMYFNEDHLDNIMKNSDVKNKLIKYIPFTIIGSLIITTITTLFVIYDINISKSLKTMYDISWFLIFVQNFFSYFCFLMNTTVFMVIIFNHKNKIIMKTNQIKEYIKTTVVFEGKIASITFDIVRMRSEYNESVDKLNSFFSSQSILTLIYIFFIFNTNINISSIDLINLSIFLLTIYTYINFAQKLKSSIDDISNAITLPIYSNNYFEQLTKIKHDEKQNFNIDNDNLHKLMIDIYICTTGVYENMGIMHLQKVIELPWNTFQIFGIQITDTTLIQKTFSIILTFLMANNIASFL